jgi:hypothetical protein
VTLREWGEPPETEPPSRLRPQRPEGSPAEWPPYTGRARGSLLPVLGWWGQERVRAWLKTLARGVEPLAGATHVNHGCGK